MIFDEEFLEPPKPGGFGQPRHWPLSYLHKEMPPNTTDSRIMRMEEENPKYAAIQNLINVIKSNDLNNIQYHISNESNKADDVLFVKIPLPTNFTRNTVISSTNANLELASSVNEKVSKRSQKFVLGQMLPHMGDTFIRPLFIFRIGFNSSKRRYLFHRTRKAILLDLKGKLHFHFHSFSYNKKLVYTLRIWKLLLILTLKNIAIIY
ncbi:hypothetical protein JTB14_033672 [Gonioctena quinquepunctata]|nr:hypothetical protein JTB14_033672 [Gonioctena quinquepunctata]